MGRFRIYITVCLVFVFCATMADASGRDLSSRRTKFVAAQKARSGAFFDKRVEPMPSRQEKPRAGWNGFYGGLNGGGVFDHR